MCRQQCGGGVLGWGTIHTPAHLHIVVYLAYR